MNGANKNLNERLSVRAANTSNPLDRLIIQIYGLSDFALFLHLFLPILKKKII